MFFCTIMLILVLAFQLLFNYFLSQKIVENKVKDSILDVFYLIENNYSNDERTLDSLLSEKAEKSNLTIMILADEGVVYANRTFINFNNPVQRPQDIREFDKASFSYEPTVTVENRFNEEHYILKGSIETDSGTWYVMCYALVESLDKSINMFSVSSAIISMTMLVFGTILIFFFSRDISRPVIEIESVAEQIANLNFKVQANENSTIKEMLGLAKSINKMSNSLSGTMNKLNQVNEQLKSDIDMQKRMDITRKVFVANVSHEMKTPLAMLMMYSECLKNNLNNIDKDYYCQTIIEETIKLNDIVRSMLDIFIVENSLEKMNMDNCNFTELISTICEQFGPMMKEYVFVYNIEDFLQAFCDKNHITQAVNNYLMNALSYTENGKRIELNCYSLNGKIRLSVYNQGNCIQPNEMDNIWQLFYKIDKSRIKTINCNAGLGLYIVSMIIKAHNGQFGVENKEDGVLFWFEI